MYDYRPTRNLDGLQKKAQRVNNMHKNIAIILILASIVIIGYGIFSFFPSEDPTVAVDFYPYATTIEELNDMDEDPELGDELLIGSYRGPGEETIDKVIDDEVVASWTPELGTPCALFGPEWYRYFEPTRENFIKWYQANEFDGKVVDPAYLAELYDTSPLAREAFALERQHQALKRFIVSYQDEFFNAYIDHTEINPLISELQPVIAYVAKYYSDSEGIWEGIDAYSASIATRTLEAGTNAEFIEDPTGYDLVDLLDKRAPAELNELKDILENWIHENY